MQKTIWLPVTAWALLAGSVSPAAAQSGVLLGLHSGGSYRTLWIATDGDSAALLARGPTLLVPRANGFWRADVIETDEDWEIAVVGPASRWAAVLDSAGEVQSPDPDARQCFPYNHEQILFLGPEYVSLRRWGGEEGCGMGGPTLRDRYVVRALDSEVRPVREVLDAAASQRLEDGVRIVRDSLRRAHLTEDPSWTEDELSRCYDTGTWGIRRKPAGWEVAASIPPFARFSCYGVRVSLTVTPPDVVVGNNRMPVDLYEVSLVIPSVRDAVSSPGGDLIVALTGDSLYAARVVDGRIQQPSLALRVQGRIVMAEWSLGRHVQRWTREVQPLLGTDEAVTRRPYSQSVAARILALAADGSRRETGSVVLVGQPAVVGFDRVSADTTLTVDAVRVDNRPLVVVPDTAREGIRLDYLSLPGFLPVGPGRYMVTGRLGPRDAWERLPIRHEFVAIDYAQGNEATVTGRQPDVRFSIPDGASGVPVAYLPRLDFSEPVRHVAGRVELRSAAGDRVPFRLAGVGTDRSGTRRVYPNLDAAGPDVLIHSATMIPSALLNFGAEYRVSFLPGILDADTMPDGTPDPQPLADPSRTFAFETYRPHVLAEGPAPAALDVATRGSTVYLAVEGADGDDRIVTMSTADPVDPVVRENMILRVGGQLRGISVANRLVAGVQRSDGSADLLVIDRSDSLPIEGVVRMPSGTQIADVAAVGPNAYVADESGAIHVVGVSGARRDPGRPPAEGTVAGTIPSLSPSARIAAIAAGDLALDGVPRTMLVTVGASPLLTVVDPVALETVATVDSVPGFRPGLRGDAVALGMLAGRQVAVVAGMAGANVGVFDLTDPRHPVPIGGPVVGSNPRSVLFDGVGALVSFDTTTRVIRFDRSTRPRVVGEIAGLGGRLAWTNGTAVSVASRRADTAGLRTWVLEPAVEASMTPPFVVWRNSLDQEGRPPRPIEIDYRIIDPPPVGEPHLFVIENARLAAAIPLTDVSPGSHTVLLPRDATFRGPSGGTVNVTLVRPDGSETAADMYRSFDEFVRRRRRPPRAPAPSEWDYHDPPPPPVPRLDSISPLHAPRGAPVTVTLFGAHLDSVWVSGWGPSPGDPTRSDSWLPQAYPVASEVGNPTVALPESLVATPGVLYFRSARSRSPRVPFLVTDPDLPPMGTASAVSDLRVAWEFDDSPRPKGYFFLAQARSTPGNRYVLGRGSTPGFVMPGVFDGPGLPVYDGRGPDDFVLAALSRDGSGLSPPIAISSIPMNTLHPDDVRVPLGPTTAHQEDCFYLEEIVDELAADPVYWTRIDVVEPRVLAISGFGLTEGMPVVFRATGKPGIEARAPLGPPEVVGVDPKSCGIDRPMPREQRARVVFTMDPESAPFVRIVWLTESGGSGRRP